MARCCLLCAVNATKAADFKRRLLRLDAVLCDFCNGTSKASASASDLETVLAHCEQYAAPDGPLAGAREAEEKAKLLKFASFSLGRYLHGDTGSKDLLSDDEDCTFEEATQFCHEALAKLQEKREKPGASISFATASYSRTQFISLTPGSSPTGPSSFVGASATWAQDRNCGICDAVLGKRRLRPRHHCRVCGKSVCNACSPNYVKIPDCEKVQRACDQCVAEMQQAHNVRHRMKRIADQLVALSGLQRTNSSNRSTLVDSVWLSEQALLTIAAAKKTSPR